jgi:hypothetical protein
MSHITTKEITIKETDLPYLKEAAAELGLVFNENKTTWHWYGSKPGDANTCSHTISVPNNTEAYEVGVVKNDDGNYKLQFDFYADGRGLNKFVGNDGNKLTQAFVNHKAIGEAKACGFSLKTTTMLENGDVQHKFVKKTLGGF